jgi:hypothetical protein
MKVVSVTGHFDLKVAKAFQSGTLSFFPLAVGPRVLPDLALVGVQLHCDDEITSYHIHLLTMSNFHLRLPLNVLDQHVAQVGMWPTPLKRVRTLLSY